MTSYGADDLAAERGAELGDPRVCRIHPHIQTSSRDGMFDGPCGACEFAMEEGDAQAEWEAQCAVTRAAVVDPEEEARDEDQDRHEAMVRWLLSEANAPF